MCIKRSGLVKNECAVSRKIPENQLKNDSKAKQGYLASHVDVNRFRAKSFSARERDCLVIT